MNSLLLRALFVSACLFHLGASAVAAPQGGYSTERHPEHGLKFDLARHFEWLAIQPIEEWIVLQWIYTGSSRRPDEDARSGRSAPRLQVVRIDYEADPGLETSGGAEPDPSGKPGVVIKEGERIVYPLNSWERYLDRELGRWVAVALDDEVEEEDGYTGRAYALSLEHDFSGLSPRLGSLGGRNIPPVGRAYVWEKPRERVFIVLAWCLEDDMEEQEDIWRRTAESMDFSEPKPDPDVARWQRYYERKPRYKNPAYRIRVRKSLNGDWEAEDTENYIIISNTPDQPLVRRIVRDMESIREEYVELFPPAEEVEAVSTVRVCADRDEYMAYGGPPSSAGYWNWVTEELVLYDGTKREKGEPTDKLDTFIVLYHEAFHQFIHYSAGKLAPHSWFNEGYGDYFSGALVKGGRVRKIGPNRWRVATIKNAVERDRHASWEDIINWEQTQYYRNGAQNYAQGWSMIYFLNTSKTVQRHDRWSRILPIYFDTLKASWKKEKALLELDDKEDDREARGKAELAARQAAVEAAFDGVDLDELESEWLEFVLDLEV